jgi:hypothetical protein
MVILVMSDVSKREDVRGMSTLTSRAVEVGRIPEQALFEI